MIYNEIVFTSYKININFVLSNKNNTNIYLISMIIIINNNVIHLIIKYRFFSFLNYYL